MIRHELRARWSAIRRGAILCALLGCTNREVWCRRCGGLVL